MGRQHAQLLGKALLETLSQHIDENPAEWGTAIKILDRYLATFPEPQWPKGLWI